MTKLKLFWDGSNIDLNLQITVLLTLPYGRLSWQGDTFLPSYVADNRILDCKFFSSCCCWQPWMTHHFHNMSSHLVLSYLHYIYICIYIIHYIPNTKQNKLTKVTLIPHGTPLRKNSKMRLYVSSILGMGVFILCEAESIGWLLNWPQKKKKTKVSSSLLSYRLCFYWKKIKK